MTAGASPARHGAAKAAPPTPAESIGAGGLVLRPWRPDDDVDEVITGWSDAETQRWMAFQTAPVESAEQVRTWLASRAESWQAGHELGFAVRDAGTAALLGSVSLHFVDRRMGGAMVGYWTMPAARGKGVATASLRAITRWAFDRVRLHRVYLGHDPDNVASCRVALRCGFAPEATLREAFRRLDGCFRDEHLHARLATDPEPETVGANA